MSLLIRTLAFEDERVMAQVRLGVLVVSVLAGYRGIACADGALTILSSNAAIQGSGSDIRSPQAMSPKGECQILNYTGIQCF